MARTRQTDLTYDVLGNITAKSDVGTYVYDAEGRLDGFGNPVQNVDQDLAGRTTVRGPLTLQWTSTERRPLRLRPGRGGDHLSEILHESGMWTAPGVGTRQWIPGSDGHWIRGATSLTTGGNDYVRQMYALRAHQEAIDRREDAGLQNRDLTHPTKPNALQNLAAGGELLDDATEVAVTYGGYASPILAAIGAGIAVGDELAENGEVGVMTAVNAVMSLAHLKAPAGLGGRGGKHNTPRSSLPRDKSGNYLPDPDAVGPHTTLGTRASSRGPYTQGATFDGKGQFKGRTDVTSHPGRPGSHPNPHFHPARGPNSVGPAQPIPRVEDLGL